MEKEREKHSSTMLAPELTPGKQIQNKKQEELSRDGIWRGPKQRDIAPGRTPWPAPVFYHGEWVEEEYE